MMALHTISRPTAARETVVYMLSILQMVLSNGLMIPIAGDGKSILHLLSSPEIM